ncbi:hypothetical protein Hypma_012127 [Hypsizygus marmoreus]|uniref:HNH nuclease domain-containing protein n=1 Tax=Hypsizygus marmoreus TaxID=39966 RepID=A0A369JLK8_HYPMA|nr:hypothetical protein Hypma_012127 [Hypsizygus marmoreus]
MATILPPVLSTQANAQHRNVFLWSTHDAHICMSWRVDEFNEITITTMYRWFDAVKKDSSYERFYGAELESIYPVDVKRDDAPLSYIVRQKGPRLLRNSKAVLMAGHYGLYEPGREIPSVLRLLLDMEASFAMYGVELGQSDPPLAAFTTLSSTLSHAALLRDQQCMLTGIPPAASDPLQVTWIVPPQMCYLLAEDRHERNQLDRGIAEEEKKYQICQLAMVLENCLTMTKDVAVLFKQNKVGIDVDDNYKIICFDMRDGDTMCLKTHFKPPFAQSGLIEKLLRAHFVRCLTTNTCDGDVRDDFPEEATKDFLDRVEFYEIADELDLNELQMKVFRKEWDTGLGKVIQQWVRERGEFEEKDGVIWNDIRTGEDERLTGSKLYA